MPNPNRTFSITLLGTDTKYKPYRDITSDYELDNLPYFNYRIQESDMTKLRGDTLSHFHSCLKGVGRQFFYLSDKKEESEYKQWINAQGQSVDEQPAGKVTHCLIEGPDTAATAVYHRIAKAVMEALNAIMRGDEVINIAGHSRGGVESILVAHELDRIQNALELVEKPLSREKLLEIICDSDGPKSTKIMTGASEALTKRLKDFSNESLASINTQKKDVRKFCANMKKVSVNLFTLDPVPGVLSATHGWHDKRYMSVAKIVKNYKQWFMVNERTTAFSGIIPSKHEDCKSYQIEAMPGHHGTPCGTLVAQDGTLLKDIAEKDKKYHHLLDDNGELKPGLTTSEVQELLVYALYDFGSNGSAEFLSQRELATHQKYDPELDGMLFRYHQLDKKGKKKLKLDCYDRINANRDVYTLFNETSYPLIGQADEEARFLRAGNGHFRKHGCYFSDVISDFVNKQHAAMFLDHHFGMYGSLSKFIESTLNSDKKAYKILNHMIDKNFTDEREMYRLIDENDAITMLFTDKVKWRKDDGVAKQLVNAISKKALSVLDDFFMKQDNNVEAQEIKKLLNLLPESHLHPLQSFNIFQAPLSVKQPEEKIKKFYQMIRFNFRKRLGSFLYNQTTAINKRKSELEDKLKSFGENREDNGVVVSEYLNCLEAYAKLNKDLQQLKEIFIETKASQSSLRKLSQAQIETTQKAVEMMCLYKKAPLEQLLSEKEVQNLKMAEEDFYHHAEIVASYHELITDKSNIIASHIGAYNSVLNSVEKFKHLKNRQSEAEPTVENASEPEPEPNVEKNKPFNLSDYSMHIIQGFSAVLGIAAVALAAVTLFTLSAALFPIGVGLAVLCSAVAGGLFAYTKTNEDYAQEPDFEEMMELYL